jgi:hypothetical protein
MDKIITCFVTLTLLLIGINTHANTRLSTTPINNCHVTIINYWPEDILIDINFDDGYVAKTTLTASKPPYQDIIYADMAYANSCQHNMRIVARRVYGPIVHQGIYESNQTAHIIVHN